MTSAKKFEQEDLLESQKSKQQIELKKSFENDDKH